MRGPSIHGALRAHTPPTYPGSWFQLLAELPGASNCRCGLLLYETFWGSQGVDFRCLVSCLPLLCGRAALPQCAGPPWSALQPR